jgi:ribose 1,5-bisphosphokinase
VPTSIDTDIAAGRTVVVNVSRSVIGEARRRYQRLVVASVTARREVVAERLHRRGRETTADIGRRLERARTIDVVGSDIYEIDNSGPIAAAGDALLSLLVNGAEQKGA